MGDEMKPNGWGDEFTPRVSADLRAMLGGGLTFKDNFNCAIVTFDAQTAVEAKIANPLSTKPIAFIPCGVQSLTVAGGVSNGNYGEFATVPVLNTSRTDGFLGVLVRYRAGTITWGRVTGILVGG